MERSEVEQQLAEVARDWDRAMVENDADAIGAFMADGWTIVGQDGSLGERAKFLDLVRSGDLAHDVMTSEELSIRVYGETAVVIARGVSAGHFRGQPFREVERSSSVFIRRGERWLCVLTHLSPLAP